MRLTKREAEQLGLKQAKVFTPMAKTHQLLIDQWHPQRVNTLLGRHWAARNRLKRADYQMVACYAVALGIPRATGKRRVSLEITLAGPGRPPDGDSYWKVVLDSLVACGLLCDDSPKWAELGPVTFSRGKERCTVITLEDI